MRKWVASVGAGYLVLGSAIAQPQQDTAELADMVRALQARVTELEAQLGKSNPKAEKRKVMPQPQPAPAQSQREARIELTDARVGPNRAPNRSGHRGGLAFTGERLLAEH